MAAKPIAGNMADPSQLNKIDKLFACGVAHDADDDHKEKAKSWAKTGMEALNPASFAEIMVEVHTVMSLGEKNVSGLRGTFSDDFLRIEICGPAQEHFSIVDVPGIFRKTTDGVTTKIDQEMVKSMVSRYMENPRSIMLTVIPANVDIATQEILTMSEDADKDGHRTLEVLTKPDLVDDGAEGPVIDLIQGTRHKLNLGWCIVRNLGQKQLQDSSASRESIKQDFFRLRTPWNKLDSDRVGIGALRTRLQEILANNIRHEFKNVNTELNRRLAAARAKLDELGAKRETPTEQSRYLTDISMRFLDVVNSALNAKYTGNAWFEESMYNRFATKVVEWNEWFAGTLEHEGYTYRFEPDGDAAVGKKGSDTNEASQANSTVKLATVREMTDSDLEDVLLFGPKTISVPSNDDIIQWLKTVYEQPRGFELGTFDISLLASVFASQTTIWEPLALGYITDIVCLAHSFVKDLLKSICPHARVRDGLMSVLMEHLIGRYRKAIDHTKFLLDVERLGTPVTLNHYFNENLEKRDSKGKTIQDTTHGAVVRLSDVTSSDPKSNKDHLIQEIHDILKSYYKVARKRFVDNVVMQAADYHMVTGPMTPMKVFTPQFVSGLRESQLEEIAGEDVAVQRKRAALTKEIADLEAGKKILF